MDDGRQPREQPVERHRVDDQDAGRQPRHRRQVRPPDEDRPPTRSRQGVEQQGGGSLWAPVGRTAERHEHRRLARREERGHVLRGLPAGRGGQLPVARRLDPFTAGLRQRDGGGAEAVEQRNPVPVEAPERLLQRKGWKVERRAPRAVDPRPRAEPRGLPDRRPSDRARRGVVRTNEGHVSLLSDLHASSVTRPSLRAGSASRAQAELSRSSVAVTDAPSRRGGPRRRRRGRPEVATANALSQLLSSRRCVGTRGAQSRDLLLSALRLDTAPASLYLTEALSNVLVK
jgi:hypothetical protein